MRSPLALLLLLSAACATPPPPPPPSPAATGPAVIPPRRPVVVNAKRVEHGARSHREWRSFSAWAKEEASRLEDDLACARAVRERAAAARDGAMSFALLVECNRQGKWRNLRLLLMRPWRRQLLDMEQEEAARLMARLIATRGGHVFDDLSFCAERGLYLMNTDDLEHSDGLETRLVMARGLPTSRSAAKGGLAMTIEETSSSDQLQLIPSFRPGRYWVRWFRRDRSGPLTTGRKLTGVGPASLDRLVDDREAVFLLKLPASPSGGDSSDKARILAAWPVGVSVPAFAGELRDRGVDAEDLQVERYTLDNGLTVILHRDVATPLVHVNVTYRVGVHHEPKGKSGFAHLFEHLMFQGSAHVGSGEHMALLESRGASYVNASTHFDQTQYAQTVPSNELELALWLEADRMRSLPEGLSAERLEIQKRVVMNERRERLEDAIYGPADALALAQLFGVDHPYHHGVIGAAADIEAATLADARAFFADFYAPANATLIVAGDFEPDVAKTWIAEHFGAIEGRVPRDSAAPSPPRITGRGVVYVRAPHAEHPRVSIIWPGPNLYGASSAALELLARALGPQGQDLIGGDLESMGIDVRDVQVGLRETLAGSWFELHVAVAGDATALAETVGHVDRLFKTLRTFGIEDVSLGVLARSIERSTLFATQTLAGKARLLARYDHLFCDPQRLRWDLERYQAVSPEHVKLALRQYLGPERLLVFALPPGFEAKSKKGRARR